MKKKILIYMNQVCLRGGVEKVFYNLINNLDLSKYDITILTTVAYIKDDLKIGIYKKPIKRLFLQYDEFSDKIVFRTYQRIYNKIAPVIIKAFVINKYWDTAIAAQEGMYAKFIIEARAQKHLLWIHNDFYVTEWSKKYFNNNREEEAKCYAKFDKVICVSDTVKESIKDTLGLSNNVIVRYNPIDTNEIDRKVNERVKENRGEKVLLLAIGRLCYQKGYDRLLKIVKKLNDDGYDFDLWILGEGECRSSIEEYISANSLTNVILLGNETNPFKYMRVADCIVSTSRFEGFNTALQEAVYLGKVIITTKCAGAVELLGESEYGIVVENDDAKMYDQLKSIMKKPEILDYYAEKVKIRKSFVNLKTRVKSIEDLL